MSDPRLRRTLYRWRVRAGTPALIGALVFARPSWTSLAAGFGISLIGLALRTWASGYLRKEGDLAVSGPYRFTRNPLYLGTIVIAAGLALASRSLPTAVFLAGYFAVFYPVIIAEERDRMRALFPESYASWEREVPLLVPCPGRTGTGKGARFDAGLFRRNRELRALLGTLGLWALMAVKVLFIRWPR